MTSWTSASLGLRTAWSTEMDVRLQHRVNLSDTLADAASLAASVKAAFPSLAPYSFQDLNKGFLTVLKQKRIWGYVIMLFILLLSAVGIVNTVLMSVYERIREVGVLKALGFRGREVVWMFIFEGFFVGCLGSFLGAALGVLIDCYTIFVGFSLQKFGDVGGGFAFWGTLRGEWNPGSDHLRRDIRVGLSRSCRGHPGARRGPHERHLRAAVRVKGGSCGISHQNGHAQPLAQQAQVNAGAHLGCHGVSPVSFPPGVPGRLPGVPREELHEKRDRAHPYHDEGFCRSIRAAAR